MTTRSQRALQQIWSHYPGGPIIDFAAWPGEQLDRAGLEMPLSPNPESRWFAADSWAGREMHRAVQRAREARTPVGRIAAGASVVGEAAGLRVFSLVASIAEICFCISSCVVGLLAAATILGVASLPFVAVEGVRAVPRIPGALRAVGKALGRGADWIAHGSRERNAMEAPTPTTTAASPAQTVSDPEMNLTGLPLDAQAAQRRQARLSYQPAQPGQPEAADPGVVGPAG